MSEQLDALHVGDWITVVSNRDDTQDRSFQGYAQEVLAIDPPFIVVRQKGMSHSFPLDSRRYGFMRLSAAYVAALITGAEALLAKDRRILSHMAKQRLK